jgi:hypothetical protein
VDSLEALPHGAQRRVFGAGRNTEEGGSLTVIASIGSSLDPQRVATTSVTLEAPADGSDSPKIASSSTLRADRLG